MRRAHTKPKVETKAVPQVQYSVAIILVQAMLRIAVDHFRAHFHCLHVHFCENRAFTEEYVRSLHSWALMNISKASTARRCKRTQHTQSMLNNSVSMCRYYEDGGSEDNVDETINASRLGISGCIAFTLLNLLNHSARPIVALSLSTISEVWDFAERNTLPGKRVSKCNSRSVCASICCKG